MHEYPLHVDVDVRCQCCGSIQPFRFTAASDHVVCAFCSKHLGSDKAERRDRDHVALWQEIEAEQDERHRAAVSAAAAAAEGASARIGVLEKQVAELSSGVIAEFDGGGAGGMRTQLENDIIRRAERNTVLERRHVDRLMAVLWGLAQLHHPDPVDSGRCACGKTVIACPELAILAAETGALSDWEARNVALLRAGERHALPSRHPAVSGADTAGSDGRRRPRR